jgi:hypothetical protein
MKQYDWELRKEDGKWMVYEKGQEPHEISDYDATFIIARRMKDDINCSFGYDYIQLDGEV